MKSMLLGISDARAAALIVFFLLCQMIAISDAAPTPILPASQSMGGVVKTLYRNFPFPGSAKPPSPPITDSGSQTVHKGDAPAPLPGSGVNPTLSSAHSGYGPAPQGHELASVDENDDWVEVGDEKVGHQKHRTSSASSLQSWHSASAGDDGGFEEVTHSQVFDSAPFGFVHVTKKEAFDAPPTPTRKPSRKDPTQHTKS